MLPPKKRFLDQVCDRLRLKNYAGDFRELADKAVTAATRRSAELAQYFAQENK